MMRFRTWHVLVLLAVTVAAHAAPVGTPPSPPAAAGASPHAAATPDAAANADFADFAARVDLTPLGEIAVYNEGRLKSFDSFAASMMRLVSGPHRIEDRPASFTYLDLMLRSHEYHDADIIYVKKKPMRAAIVQSLQGTPRAMEASFDTWTARFMETGLLSEDVLHIDEVSALLGRLSADLIRTAKYVDMLETALVVMEPQTLLSSWRIIPPADGDRDDPWLSLDTLVAEQGRAAAMPETQREQIVAAWRALFDAWVAEDSDGVNRAVTTLAQVLPTVNPELYPTEARSGWPWSFSAEQPIPWFVVGAFLLLALAGTMLARGRLRRLSIATVAGLLIFNGMTLWLNGYGMALTSSIVTHPEGPLAWESFYFRSYNLTWFWVFYALSLVPLLLDTVFRWPAARWIGLGLFLLAFALHTFSLVLRWYVAQRWPNTNMFEAVTTAAWFGGAAAILLEIIVGRGGMRNLFALGSAVASMVALMCVYYFPLELDAGISNRMPVLHDVWLYIHTNVIIFSYCLIFMAAVSALLYLLYRVFGLVFEGKNKDDYARVGGAGSLMTVTPTGETAINRGSSIGQVLDGTTMVLMELSFVMLWAGLVMGAIWADHSWGRPWGWDPKEVFALNTFLVFAVLIHVRLKTRDKGLWTALIAMVGAAVMLFNWIIINFVISGLHSYA